MNRCLPSRVGGALTLVDGFTYGSERTIVARRQFLKEGVDPVAEIPATILRSWRRSAENGLDMASGPEVSVLSGQVLRETQERNDALVRAARGEMEALAHDVSATGGIVILTDQNGIVLISVGSGEFATRAASVALQPGATWDEATIGTNAIGTALAEREPISVVGGEHFFEVHCILNCSAIPILDPCGVVIGVLDLTNPSDVPQVHTLALLHRAVEQIENRLFKNRFGSYEHMRFHIDPYLVGSSHEGLIAFDGERLVGANRRGLNLLNLNWSVLGACRFNELFTVERGNIRNSSSDDCLVRTRDGKTLFARMQPRRRAGPARGNGHHACSTCLEKKDGELDLCQIIDKLLRCPSARQVNVRHVKTGQLIYGADEEATAQQGLLIVRAGRLRCFASFEGKELTLFTLDAGDAILLHPGSVFEVKKDAEIVTVSMAAFRQLTQCDPDLAVSAMPVFDRILRKSLQMNEDMVFRGVRHRLIRAISDTAERDGRKLDTGIVLDTPPNAEDFAMQVGATRQSVSTVIAELIRDGVIRRVGGSAMVIPDISRLKQELSCDQAEVALPIPLKSLAERAGREMRSRG